ncbi:hypothetical protein HanRHA438_Chr14g0652761 [Helianthus annuus]|nr:hypothetical protein HanIR_Chr14g0696641 [Helianthus annuus]KAJ0853573.1 hypothetical protein HanRHA438_Chr14g0652761 [Helianthus annuus]
MTKGTSVISILNYSINFVQSHKSIFKLSSRSNFLSPSQINTSALSLVLFSGNHSNRPISNAGETTSLVLFPCSTPKNSQMSA